jgi:hypothetical protein
MLSPQLLGLLRDWYRVARPQGWLFPGENPVNPMTTRQLTRLSGQREAHNRLPAVSVMLTWAVDRRAHVDRNRPDVINWSDARLLELRRSIRILDVSLRPIAARGRLDVPAAVVVLVFNHLRVARHALLGRGRAGRREGLGVGRKWLREHAVDHVSPAVVVPDDLICDMRHRFTCQ